MSDMKSRQCTDAANAGANSVNGTSAKEHKAARINGNQSGEMKPAMTQGTK